MSPRILRFQDAASECQNVHFVNFKSQKDCDDLRTEEYFESQLNLKNNGNDKDLHASFRGRPMNGRKYDLPEQYQMSKMTKDDKNEIVVEKLGKTVTSWNLDKLASGADALPQFTQWLEINDALHGHVQIDD